MQPLQIGKELQLLIATTEDIQQQLEPLRRRRARRSAKVAAGVGAATSAVVGGAMWMANLGFWASLGTALGLAAVPVVVTVAGVGGLTLVMRRRGGTSDRAQQEQVALTLACFQMMAEADGRISDEERRLLRAVTLQYPLSDVQRRDIESRTPLATIDSAGQLDIETRREVSRGCWMLAEADGVTPEEERLFTDLAGRFELAGEERELKRDSREQQAAANDLITAMFRTCQQTLAGTTNEAGAADFLESLALLAATPTTRRSLRNSIKSGFSAGGVGRLLDEHGQRSKLIAQAHNAIRSVFPEEQRKDAIKRLMELVDSTSCDRAEVRRICADVDLLFDDALRS